MDEPDRGGDRGGPDGDGDRLRDARCVYNRHLNKSGPAGLLKRVHDRLAELAFPGDIGAGLVLQNGIPYGLVEAHGHSGRNDRLRRGSIPEIRHPEFDVVTGCRHAEDHRQQGCNVRGRGACKHPDKIPDSLDGYNEDVTMS